MLEKFNFLCSFHNWVSFLKIYGFNEYNKFQLLTYEQLTCLCIICPAFVIIEKNYLGSNTEMKFWSSTELWMLSEWLTFSSWLCLLQFLSVTLPVMEIKPHLFYQVVKNLGRPRPLTAITLVFYCFESDNH